MLPISGKGALRPIGGIGSAGAKWLIGIPTPTVGVRCKIRRGNQTSGYTPEGTS